MRPWPQGIEVVQADSSLLFCRIQCVHRLWRLVPLPILVLGIPVFGGYGFYASINSYPPNWGVLFLFLLIPIGLGFWARSMARFKLEIVATKDRLRIGKLVFDRAFVGGMRTGYETGGEAIKETVFDWSIAGGFKKLTGLAVSYGRWGEETNYLVNGYLSAQYVVWLNDMIAAVGAPPPREHDLASGRRKENFGLVSKFVPPAPKPAPEKAAKPTTQSQW